MVEKMKLVTVVGELAAAEKTLKSLITMGEVNVADAAIGLEVIRENYNENWQIPAEILGGDTEKFVAKQDLSECEEKLLRLFKQTELPLSVDNSLIDLAYSRQDLIADVTHMDNDFSALNAKINELNEKYQQLAQFCHVDQLDKVDFDLAKLQSLQHFDIQLGQMSYQYERRLEMNYDNINALVLRAGSLAGEALYFFITPKILRQQTDNLLRSMHFTPIEILWQYMDYPAKMAERLRADMADIERQITDLRADIEQYLLKHQAMLVKAYSHLNLEASYDDVVINLLHNQTHFVCAFWLTTAVAATIEQSLCKGDANLICAVHDDDAVSGVVVPTKLRNKWLFRPFEMLVSLYGTPNYREVDPTGFMALSYMFLFGAMFGDLGQGFIFWLAGSFIKRRPKMASIAGVLKRIGFASMIFGVIYDSIFGIEHAISHFLTEIVGLHFLASIFLRPIENTNLMLMMAIAVGIVFLLISFGYSIYNKLKNGDVKEGVFGRNGINGLVLFIALLAIGGMVYFNWPNWGIRLGVVVVGISVLLLIIREPLSNYMAKKLPLYHEGAAAYYTEAGFELLETFLGMLSNGISFIRVGAFALNHVGLFIAFQTIARMIGNDIGNVAMFILGNALVIGLEGLIVFIQGLRLVYYEMFSKFYSGDGQPFVGMAVDMHYDNESEG